MMPIIYTPTVGQACKEYGHIWRRPRGLFLSVNEQGRMVDVLRNWPHRDVGVIVVTDGERILGLGDLGANGMGIPVGKLSLYTACAGVNPRYCLPITLDMGTNNQELLGDPLYIGLQQPRLCGPDFDDFVSEFMEAVAEVFPQAMVQFEDFGNTNAFRLLETYRDRACCFNDDIQGTAAVALAGILGATRITGRKLSEEKLVFLGAGEAAVGIADLVVAKMVKEGLAEAEARERCWMVDSRGLVVKSRNNLQAHKLGYAHDAPFLPDLAATVETLKPTGIIGVSGQPQTFTQPIVEAVASMNERPIVFALSNPTSKAECTAEQAYQWTGGRAIFASGSPFAPVTINGKKLVPGQGNNAYIFPGVGLAVTCCRVSRVTDEMFLASAESLASQVSQADLDQGCVYPPLPMIREVSARIAADVAEVAYQQKLARVYKPEDMLAFMKRRMYDGSY